MPLSDFLDDRAYDVGADHKLKDGGNLGADCLRHVLILVLEVVEELLAHLVILGYLERYLSFQCAIARWLHVKITAELLLLFAQTVPLLVDLQMLKVTL